jgi:hypothetical protein
MYYTTTTPLFLQKHKKHRDFKDLNTTRSDIQTEKSSSEGRKTVNLVKAFTYKIHEARIFAFAFAFTEINWKYSAPTCAIKPRAKKPDFGGFLSIIGFTISEATGKGKGKNCAA